MTGGLRSSLALLSSLAALISPLCARASPASIERGRWLAQANCASCHAIDRERSSPDPQAPRFADLQRLNPSRNMDEIYAHSLSGNHAPMPQFAPGPDDIQDLVDYLQSVQVRPPAR